jgi:molybdenum cofactor cytidylyltransferase
MICRVSAILLAAGSSRRMGQPKQFLPLRDKPVINHCLDNIIAANIKDIVVMLNADGRDWAEQMSRIRVTIAFNDDPDSDMSESVRKGLLRLEPFSSGVLICLSDHPLVTAETMKTLVEWHEREPQKIIIPSYNGKRGHPGLFPIRCASEIDQGFTLRDIVKRDEKRLRFVEVTDEGVVFDMDMMEDYERINRLINERSVE